MTARRDRAQGLAGHERQAQGGRRASSSAGATTSTTSCCPECCTWRSCAARIAHATINSIDTSRAAALPGVVAVVTGELLAEHNLAWMPTLSGDTQAVLATDKVRMQGQEVACVIAEDPYVAHDALELIDVDYEPLPVDHDAAGRRSRTDAPVIRDDKEGQADNRVYHWEAGDAEATERAFADADRVVRLVDALPALPSGAARVLRLRRRRQPGDRQDDDLHDLAGAARAPHGVRARRRACRSRTSRSSRRTSAAASATRCPIYPGYVVATAASLLLGRPVKWIEDRTGNLISTGFARDFHMDGELALTNDGTMTGLRVKMLSDQGYAYADAQPSKFKAGLFHIVTGSYDIPAAHVVTDGAYTNKAPGGVAYRCSFRVTEASYLIERLVQTAAYELGHRPGRAAAAELHPAGQVPVHVGDRLRVRLRRLRAGARPGARAGRLHGAARGAEAGARGGPAARHRPRELHRGRRRRAEPAVRHPRHQDVRLRRAAACTRPARRSSSSASSRRARATRRRSRRSSPRSSGIPPEDVIVQEGDTDNTPYGLGTYASRSTPIAGAATAVVARKVRDKAQKIAAHLLEACRGRPRVVAAQASPSRARPTGRRRSRRSPSPPTPNHPRGDGGRARGRRTTTTRRT